YSVCVELSSALSSGTHAAAVVKAVLCKNRRRSMTSPLLLAQTTTTESRCASREIPPDAWFDRFLLRDFDVGEPAFAIRLPALKPKRVANRPRTSARPSTRLCDS